MRLFFDRRLGYLVTAPGQESALSGLTGKAGDTAEVQIVFGRSSDPTGAASIIESPTWTPENLAGGTVITIGIKEDGDYSDGTLLAGTSSFSLDVPTNTYTFTLPLNTTAINTALLRLDANAANDIASLNCQFEVTYQVGGSGGWESSILPVPFLLYNDVIGGDEGTPTNADDPTEYLLKAAGIEWLPSVTSKIGGTAADLDAIPTVARPLNALVAFLDQDATNQIRVYRLESGTDAESSPDVIRPDDYNGTTNARVWKAYNFGGMVNPMTTAGDVIIGGASGAPARIAGVSGKFLRSNGGALSFESVYPGNPTSSEDITSNASVTGARKFSLLKLDTTSSSIDLTIHPDSTENIDRDTAYWVVPVNGANAATLVQGSGVSLHFNNSTGSVILAGGTVYHFYKEAANTWRILSKS